MSAFSDAIALMDRAVLGHLNTGHTIVYRAGDGIEQTLENAIFDALFELVGAGTSGVSSTAPTVFFSPLSALGSDPNTDEDARVFVDDVEYKIRESHTDGVAGVMLLLTKVRRG